MSSLNLRHVLCPVDLSEISGAVLSWAGLFCKKFGARMTVFHADWFELPPYFTRAQIDDFSRQAEDQRHALAGSLEQLADDRIDPSVETSVVVERGHAVELIVRVLERDRPDLVVLGSEGRSGIARLMMGSVAENVVRAARSPVLVVRSSEFPDAVRKVLAPVEFTESSGEVLRIAGELSGRFGAELLALHLSGESPVEADRDRLCAFIPAEVRDNCRVREVVRGGNPAEQVVLAAREEKVDLVVTPVERQPFLEFTTLGSETERVMRHCSRPVLTVPFQT